MILKTLKEVAHFLSEAGIPYMVIGGQAVLQYGEPRFTQDIVEKREKLNGLNDGKRFKRDLTDNAMPGRPEFLRPRMSPRQ